MSIIETYDQWQKRLEQMSFDDRARAYRDKILESPEFDDVSRKYFNDAFDYVMELKSKNKPLDTNLLRIRMTEVKNNKGIDFDTFTRTMMLLSLCGFQFTYQENSAAK